TDVDDAACIAAAFKARGWSHRRVYLSDGAGDDAVLGAIRAVTAEVGDLEGVIRIAPRVSRGDELEAAVACLQAVATASRAVAAMPATPRGLWVVTSGGVAVSPGRDAAESSV